MTVLELSDEQRDALIRVLERTIGDQHTEISRTDDRQWKLKLRREQEVLSSVLNNLKIERERGLGGLTPTDLHKSLRG